MSSPPTSASVSESAVIAAPLSRVWHLIKLQDFDKFWSKLKASDYVQGVSPETDIVKWTFKDGEEWDVKLEEHSVWCSVVGEHMAIWGCLASWSSPQALVNAFTLGG